jgi:hypothetical protein
MSGTSAGLFFLLIGVALVSIGYALLTNHRGAQDWLLAADEHRYRLYGKGTSLFAPSRKGVKRFGWVLFVLGCAFLVAGFSQI